MDSLSRTEHERWCAFHYANGWDTMSDEEWQARADIYKKEVQEKGSSDFRISKNTAGKTHACLVSWEDLKLLDKKENAVTGGHKDYQLLDTNNVMAIPELLREEK